MANVPAFTLLIKPVSGRCNLRCGYCFYLDIPGTVYRNRPLRCMNGQTLEILIRRYLEYRFPVSSFAWQGGEPSLAGLDFFQEAVRLEQKHGVGGQSVSNGFQTNGLLLDEEWARFFAQYSFLIGLSLDGPPEIHNRYRTGPDETGSHERVLHSLRLLQRFEVSFNVLCVISRANVDKAAQLYNYFRGLGVTHVQFIPCVERDPNTGQMAEFTPDPGAYADFLCEMFDLWEGGDPCLFSIRDFDAILEAAVDGRASLCIYGKRCDHYFLIEHNGDVYPCDFFCDPDWKLGNINQHSFDELIENPRRLEFASLKSQYPSNCRLCEYVHLCHGGCTKDRLNGWGDARREGYYCRAYQQFFSHALPGFERLSERLQHERKQAADLELRRRQQAALRNPANSRETAKTKRNDPCPCGSGRKFKNCCMK